MGLPPGGLWSGAHLSDNALSDVPVSHCLMRTYLLYNVDHCLFAGPALHDLVFDDLLSDQFFLDALVCVSHHILSDDVWPREGLPRNVLADCSRKMVLCQMISCQVISCRMSDDDALLTSCRWAKRSSESTKNTF